MTTSGEAFLTIWESSFIAMLILSLTHGPRRQMGPHVMLMIQMHVLQYSQTRFRRSLLLENIFSIRLCIRLYIWYSVFEELIKNTFVLLLLQHPPKLYCWRKPIWLARVRPSCCYGNHQHRQVRPNHSIVENAILLLTTKVFQRYVLIMSFRNNKNTLQGTLVAKHYLSYVWTPVLGSIGSIINISNSGSKTRKRISVRQSLVQNLPRKKENGSNYYFQ